MPAQEINPQRICPLKRELYGVPDFHPKAIPEGMDNEKIFCDSDCPGPQAGTSGIGEIAPHYLTALIWRGSVRRENTLQTP